METRFQYFDRLCRTCMNKVEASSHDGTTIPQQQWLSIFDTIEECGALRIAELLSDAVPQIVVQPSDELPKKICTECLQRLLTVYRFQQMCVQSDKQMHELLSKEQTLLKTPMLEGAIKGETETNDAEPQPLKELGCSSTLQNLQQPSIQEPLAEVTFQTIEPEAAQSSADDNLQDNTQLLEQCMDAQSEFKEFIKNEPNEGDLKTPVLEEAIKGATETNYADSQPLKELRCSSTLQNLQQPSIQEPLAEFTVQTIEPKAAQSSAANHLQDNTQLLEYCNNSQGEFEEFIKNEPIEDDEEANSEYSDGDTIHSIISVTKEEVLPIEFDDQQVNDAIPAEQRTTHAEDKPYECPYCPLRFSSKRNASRHKIVHEGIKPHKCGICGKEFRRKYDLKRHKEIHSKEKQHKCDQCEMRIPAEQRTTHAEDKPYECPYCPLRFSSKRNASRHKIVHEGIKPHKCGICGKEFRRKSDLKRHKEIHSKEKQHKCDQCEMRFTHINSLKNHIRKHTGEKPYKCKYCEREFALLTTLRYHLVSHLGKNIERCKFCPLAFPSSAEMRLHLTSHKNEDPETRERNVKALQKEEAKLVLKFSKEKSKEHLTEGQQQQKLSNKEIEQRSTEFTHMQPLQSHNRTHTGEKPYKCKYCERGFGSDCALSQHLRRHLGKNIHRCKFCPLAFPLKSEMLSHLTSHKNENPEVRERNLKALQEEEAKLVLKFSKEKSKVQSTEEQQQQKLSNKAIEQQSTDIPAEQHATHAEDKPYECPYCPLRFSAKRNASRHKTIHEGIKPHKCSICGKKFRLKHALTMHKRIHSNEKPQKCDQCEMRFIHMQELKNHSRKHTGEKPYKCKYCERAFAERGTLRYHLRSHLGKNIHRCKFCPLAFSSSAEMRLHFISHKNEDREVRERNLKALQEEEAKLKLKFSNDISKVPSTEEQQQEKLCTKEIA